MNENMYVIVKDSEENGTLDALYYFDRFIDARAFLNELMGKNEDKVYANYDDVYYIHRVTKYKKL